MVEPSQRQEAPGAFGPGESSGYRESMKPNQKPVDACNSLIPGYTGYVPQRFYRIGTTYGDDSMACMTSFHNATQRSRDAQNELRYIAATTPKLPSICSNEDVLQALYDYNYKHHPYVLGTVITKRSLLEPPIPGWTGFVPRARVTELGYGVRYHETTKNCYQDFKNLSDRVCYDPTSNLQRGKMHEVKVSKVPNTYQRFYRPEGMLPKYSGHIPHEHLVIGKTFGNLCRSCSVCTHTEESYGAHLTKKRNATLKLPKHLKCNMKS
ncbi:potassium channel subfamily K member 16 [Platysternon megacephalum]|uniref:Potassium channel subfamily K member 16 n=1 Tax=Platysternon megacephalum TaxID=55544 RepID=A0A4D9ERU1_9SAUR|nr:potassium channel subfamily K member 16 [Platysternon megacephalum]